MGYGRMLELNPSLIVFGGAIVEASAESACCCYCSERSMCVSVKIQINTSFVENSG